MLRKKVFEIGFKSHFSSPKTIIIEENKMTIKYHDTAQLSVREIDGYKIDDDLFLLVWGKKDEHYWTENLGPVISESEE